MFKQVRAGFCFRKEKRTLRREGGKALSENRTAADRNRFSKKKLRDARGIKERQEMIDRKHRLSIRKQCDLLCINRSNLYYSPQRERDANLILMTEIDKIHLKYPSFGIRRITRELREIGFIVNRKRVRRLMQVMGIATIYPKRNLSKLGKTSYIRPYLLRGLKIERPNQVWQIDISYIPMKRGFMYLTAIIDVYSRYIVGWQLSNTLEMETQTSAMNEAIKKYGKPEIVNSDQGSQYTSNHWIESMETHGVKISMDGKGRATDNIYIERFFRTIKYDYIYLNPVESGWELYEGIRDFISGYHRRSHQGINLQKPKDLFIFEPTNKLKSA
ncbi:IS3 family transposase [Cruoricaptor ignavus]|nr:IS3 family transposase [Cruoricaptor ignavus]